MAVILSRNSKPSKLHRKVQMEICHLLNTNFVLLSATADHGDITRYLVGVNNAIIQKLGIALGIVYGWLQNTQSPSFVNNMVALW